MHTNFHSRNGLSLSLFITQTSKISTILYYCIYKYSFIYECMVIPLILYRSCILHYDSRYMKRNTFTIIKRKNAFSRILCVWSSNSHTKQILSKIINLISFQTLCSCYSVVISIIHNIWKAKKKLFASRRNTNEKYAHNENLYKPWILLIQTVIKLNAFSFEHALIYFHRRSKMLLQNSIG